MLKQENLIEFITNILIHVNNCIGYLSLFFNLLAVVDNKNSKP